MRSYIGIDIGFDAVKIVELRKKRGQLVLKRVGVINIKDIPFHDGLGKEDLAAESIKWILAKYNIKRPVVAVTLPSNLIYSKYFTLPAVSAEKINQIIQFEARQQIPFPLEEICWDYSVLGQSFNKEEINIVLHAVKKNIAYTFMENLISAGLDISIIDINSMALYNVLIETDNVTETILVDIGAKSTNLILLEQGSCWTRNLPIGGNEFTQKIANEMNIPFEEAEILKKEIGLQGEGDDLRISNVLLKEGVEKLINEIQRTIGYYRSKKEGLIIRKLILSGGNARLKGLLTVFMDSLKMDVEILDPFNRVIIDTELDIEKVDNVRNNFAVALGLALRHVGLGKVQINLIPDDIQKERYISKNKIFLWFSAFILLLFFILFNYNIALETKKDLNNLDEIKTVLQKYNEMKDETQKLETSFTPKLSKLKVLQDLLVRRLSVLDTILFIKKITSKDIWFDFFSYGINIGDIKLIENKKNIDKMRYRQKKGINKEIKENYLEIKGYINDSYKKLDNIILALSANPLFDSVKIIDAKEYLKDKRRQIEFKLLIGFKGKNLGVSTR